MQHKPKLSPFLLGAALFAALLGLLVAGCGGQETDTSEPDSAAPAESEPKRGGTLRVAVVKDHSTFDPPVVLAVLDIQVTRQAYDNLILRDPDDLSLIPMLAESWEPNDDLTQYTFQLRQGVMFHHGKEFKAEDVVFTFNRLLDPDVGSPIAATLDFVTNVVALDDWTVRFDLERPSANLPDLVALYHARIIPSDIRPERLVTEEFGTGPFFLKEHVEDERIVIARNAECGGRGTPISTECSSSTFRTLRPERVRSRQAWSTSYTIWFRPASRLSMPTLRPGCRRRPAQPISALPWT